MIRIKLCCKIYYNTSGLPLPKMLMPAIPLYIRKTNPPIITRDCQYSQPDLNLLLLPKNPLNIALGIPLSIGLALVVQLFPFTETD